MRKKAFLFDLNGTMVDDMQYHIQAWHKILNDLGADISLARMKEECYGKNEELLERIFPGRFNEAEIKQMSFDKESQYQQHFKPYLKLLPGLDVFLKTAFDQQISMAIGSAAIMFNIDFVLDNCQIRSYFQALVSAESVKESKPDPETFLTCQQLLKVQPQDCIVFEDSVKGVESAKRAGMKTVVITTLHEPQEFAAFDNILFFIKDYKDERLQTLFN
ncbi:MAG: hypothetical protein RLY16_2468 [Bacteroidota bacterium]|jgi:beta-phosphoglucomutase family hydrolase